MLFEFFGSLGIICEKFKYLAVFNTREALESGYFWEKFAANLMSWASELGSATHLSKMGKVGKMGPGKMGKMGFFRSTQFSRTHLLI